MDYLNEIDEIWSMVKERLSQKISSAPVILWFGCSEIISFENNTITLAVESDFKKKIICEK